MPISRRTVILPKRVTGYFSNLSFSYYATVIMGWRDRKTICPESIGLNDGFVVNTVMFRLITPSFIDWQILTQY